MVEWFSDRGRISVRKRHDKRKKTEGMGAKRYPFLSEPVGVFAFFKNLGVTSRYKRTPKPSMWTRRTDKTPKTYGCSLDDFRGQSCPVQAWVVRRLTAWCLPGSRRRKTHVCVQRLVGILQRQRQTEDLCFHSSLHSHWFLFSRSSRLPRYLHFFGWEII